MILLTLPSVVFGDPGFQHVGEGTLVWSVHACSLGLKRSA